MAAGDATALGVGDGLAAACAGEAGARTVGAVPAALDGAADFAGEGEAVGVGAAIAVAARQITSAIALRMLRQRIINRVAQARSNRARGAIVSSRPDQNIICSGAVRLTPAKESGGPAEAIRHSIRWREER